MVVGIRFADFAFPHWDCRGVSETLPATVGESSCVQMGRPGRMLTSGNTKCRGAVQYKDFNFCLKQLIYVRKMLDRSQAGEDSPKKTSSSQVDTHKISKQSPLSQTHTATVEPHSIFPANVSFSLLAGVITIQALALMWFVLPSSAVLCGNGVKDRILRCKCRLTTNCLLHLCTWPHSLTCPLGNRSTPPFPGRALALKNSLHDRHGKKPPH